MIIRDSCSAPVELLSGSSSAPKLLFGACSIFKRKGVEGLQENSDKKCDTSGFPISQILSAITFTDSETICKKRHRFSECSFQKCRCEAIFYRKILKLFFKNSIDNKYQHEGGKFQPKNTCKPVVTGRTEWKCCGRYPDRKPYNRVTRNCRNPEL